MVKTSGSCSVTLSGSAGGSTVTSASVAATATSAVVRCSSHVQHRQHGHADHRREQGQAQHDAPETAQPAPALRGGAGSGGRAHPAGGEVSARASGSPTAA